jgi:hypothetical protein
MKPAKYSFCSGVKAVPFGAGGEPNPPPTPPKEGSVVERALAQFPSWEG